MYRFCAAESRIQNPESTGPSRGPRPSSMCACAHAHMAESRIHHPPSNTHPPASSACVACADAYAAESRIQNPEFCSALSLPAERPQFPESRIHSPAAPSAPPSTDRPVSRIQNPQPCAPPLPTYPTSFQNPESKPPGRSGPLRTRPDQFPESRCLETEPAKSRIQKNRICKLVLGTWRHAALK